jgi:alpha-tubulin suppressor-like RCC1 family protein
MVRVLLSGPAMPDRAWYTRPSLPLAVPAAALVLLGACGIEASKDAAHSSSPDAGPTALSFGDGGNAATCDPSGPDQEDCVCAEIGTSRSCYSGPPATRSVGACHDGMQACDGQEFGTYGACTGEVLPSSESCSSTADTNCNGKVGCADPVACPSGCPNTAAPPMHRIVGGWGHVCVLTAAGSVKCWGCDSWGQLGDGQPVTNASKVDSPVPVDVVGLTGIVGISAGEEHTCAVTAGGAVYCWGEGEGFGMSGAVSTPVAIPGLEFGVAQVAAGELHTCVLLRTGTVQCWGSGSEMEPGADFHSPTPTPVPGLSSVAAIASGDGYACALGASGTVQCWGGNLFGELGTGSMSPLDSPMPVTAVGLGSGVLSLATLGGSQTCAVTAGGGVLCWGNNSYGQLGTGSKMENSPTPTVVSGLGSGVQSVAASGEYHACALLGTGAVECWGDGEEGQLGDGSFGFGTKSSVPVAVSGLGPGVVDIATGDAFTCAMFADGSVQCWGDDTFSEMGGAACSGYIDATPLCPTPVSITGL